MVPPQARRLPTGRLHLQHGPIDLVVDAVATGPGGPSGPRAQDAYRAAEERFATILDELCGELPALRRPACPDGRPPAGPVAARMWAAVLPFASGAFVTPMAAVAGAVADEVLAAMLAAADLNRASVNNGGDVAIFLRPGERARLGLVDRPDRPSLFGTATLSGADCVGGVATSGWRGRSFSLGIADAVTVLARTAAAADAAATLVANAVDLPGHPAVTRCPASAVQADSDLGDRSVTRDVRPLAPADIRIALAAGRARAEPFLRRGLVAAAALHLQGTTELAGGHACLAAHSRSHSLQGSLAA